MIYFNAAGISPFNQTVQEEVQTTLEHFRKLLYSNDGIQFYRRTLQSCRQQIAEWLEVEDTQCVAFVPNATTASRLIFSRIHWKPGDCVLTTTHENATVLNELSGLHIHGVSIQSLDPESSTEFETEIEYHLKSTKVRAIVISHVSHIDGRVFPIERIAQLSQNKQTLLIVDGAQAVGHIPVSFPDNQPDAYFFPGHKWCAGPMGTGALILGKQFLEKEALGRGKKPETTQPLWAEFELGTQNIGLIVGLAKACRIKQQDGLKTNRLEHIREEVQQQLLNFSQFKILEWKGPHSPGILSFTYLNQQTEDQLQSKTHDIVWKTFSLPKNAPQTSIRLSWSSDTTNTDVGAFLDLLQNTL